MPTDKSEEDKTVDRELEAFEIETDIHSDNGGAAPKRKRGRPKGSKGKPKVEGDPRLEEAAITATPMVESPEIADPFDVSRLKVRLAPGLISQTKPVTIAVTKPRPDWWIRTHHEDGLVMTLLAVKDENDIDETIYWIDPAIEGEMLARGWGRAYALFRTITSLGAEFLWRIPLPGEGRRPNKWTESAAILAGEARTEWLRVVSKNGRYEKEPLEDEDTYGDPAWSTFTMTDLNRLAFGSRHITTRDHPEILKLRGKKVPKK